MKLITTQTRLTKKLGALSLIAALVFNPLAAVTQAANEISRLVPFQGRLHGTDNKAVADGVYDITFNVYDTPTGGTPAWTESHSQVSVIHGYVNVLLGAITPMHDVNYANVTGTPAYDSSKNLVDFTTKKYLGISINGGVEMFPRSQLVPSFHAYTANHADHATQADNADNLGGKAANTYAQLSYVNAADGVLNQRITDEIAGVDGDTATLSSRTTTLENKFTGARAKNAELLDGLNSTSYMRQSSDGTYWGLYPNGDHSPWVRTTVNGFIPYQSGGSSSLGTDTWPFSKIYGNDIYDNGTLLESKYLGISATAADSNLLDSKNSSHYLNASNLDAGTVAVARLPNATQTVAGVSKTAYSNTNLTKTGISEYGYFWDRNTGFLMQWGRSSYNSKQDVTDITFPISYSNSGVNVVTTVKSPGWVGGHVVYVLYTTSSLFRSRANTDQGDAASYYWQATGYRDPSTSLPSGL